MVKSAAIWKTLTPATAKALATWAQGETAWLGAQPDDQCLTLAENRYRTALEAATWLGDTWARVQTDPSLVTNADIERVRLLLDGVAKEPLAPEGAWADCVADGVPLPSDTSAGWSAPTPRPTSRPTPAPTKNPHQTWTSVRSELPSRLGDWDLTVQMVGLYCDFATDPNPSRGSFSCVIYYSMAMTWGQKMVAWYDRLISESRLDTCYQGLFDSFRPILNDLENANRSMSSYTTSYGHAGTAESFGI